MDKLILGTTYFAKGILFGTIVYAIIFCAAKVTGCRKEKISGACIAVEWIFTIYLVTLLQITGVFSIFSWDFTMSGTCNWVPFVNEEIKLVVLNVLLFIPMGFFVPLVIRKNWDGVRTIVFGACCSLLIELSQMFLLGRTADVDDLLTNTAGSAIGYALFLCGRKLWQRSNERKQIGVGTFDGFAAIIVLLFCTPFKRIYLGDVLLLQCAIPIWSGNSESVYSMSGIHYTLIFGLLLELLFLAVCKKRSSDFGAKAGFWISIGAGMLILLMMGLEQMR